MKEKILAARTGWLLLAAYVIIWDLVAIRHNETLSAGFARTARHPIRRWPLILVWTVTTLHLFGRLPERIDPYMLGVKIWRRWLR